MKNFLFLPLLAILLFTSSCKKEESTPTNNTTTATQEMVATFDGSQWTATVITTQTPLAGVRIISGTNPLNGRSIVLTVNSITKTGDYDIGGFANTNTATLVMGLTTYSTQSLDINAPAVGKVTITELTDSQMKGTFNFSATNTAVATDTKSISGGRFAINLK